MQRKYSHWDTKPMSVPIAFRNQTTRADGDRKRRGDGNQKTERAETKRAEGYGDKIEKRRGRPKKERMERPKDESGRMPKEPRGRRPKLKEDGDQQRREARGGQPKVATNFVKASDRGTDPRSRLLPFRQFRYISPPPRFENYITLLYP